MSGLGRRRPDGSKQVSEEDRDSVYSPRILTLWHYLCWNWVVFPLNPLVVIIISSSTSSSSISISSIIIIRVNLVSDLGIWMDLVWSV